MLIFSFEHDKKSIQMHPVRGVEKAFYSLSTLPLDLPIGVCLVLEGISGLLVGLVSLYVGSSHVIILNLIYFSIYIK